MVNIRQSTLEFSGPAFDEAVQRAINALLPGLTSQITSELCQNGAGEMPREEKRMWQHCHVRTFVRFSFAIFPYVRAAKYEREYYTIPQREDELTGEFMKRFLRLTSFVRKKAGPTEEQAKHFK
uniref:Zinc finger, CCHC-type, retrotransposon Gag domain protein n=1 Tax=Tanacetum cinerariifolium TaxID=118510 RepID=A0A699SYR2_TANCI|nr:hypothetical protein [Tanacetum cinerariifolium]